MGKKAKSQISEKDIQTILCFILCGNKSTDKSVQEGLKVGWRHQKNSVDGRTKSPVLLSKFSDLYGNFIIRLQLV